MTHFRKLFDPAKYIGSWDLLTGRDTIVTIASVVGEELTAIGGRVNRKPVLYFKGSARGLALNKTNARTLATLYGVEIEGWVGKKIALYRSMTRAPDGSGEIECIRCRPSAPKASSNSDSIADTSPAHQSAAPLGEAETTGAPQPQPGAAAAPSDVETFRILLHDWVETIKGSNSADAVADFADRAPDKVKATDEFAVAVNARLDQLKERK